MNKSAAPHRPDSEATGGHAKTHSAAKLRFHLKGWQQSSLFLRLIIPYTADLADSYAEIRARLKVSSAVAIHLACAAKAGADLFLTNDNDLIGQVVPGIQFIAGLDTNII